MCDHDNREAAMDGGIRTVASCCGHGRRPGNIALADGRELFVAPDFDTAREVDGAFPCSRGRGDPVDERWQGVGS